MAVVKTVEFNAPKTGNAGVIPGYQDRVYPSGTTYTQGTLKQTTAPNPTKNALQQAISAYTPTMYRTSLNEVTGSHTPIAKLDQSLQANMAANPISSNAIASANASGSNGASGGNGSSGNGSVLGFAEAPSQTSDYMAQLSAMLQAQQQAQQAQLQANQAAHQALVEQAYQNNMNALLSAYGNQQGNLGNIYNNTMGQLESNYLYGADKIAQDRENALREAYVNRMMSQKNLPQQLNAAGLTGGAAESAVAQLLNNYGNARNSIETQSMNDLANLLNQYQNNANSAGQQYAQALNDLEASNYNYQSRLNNDLTNGVIGTYDDLYKALNSGTNTYANAMQGLASNLVGNAADLDATNYKNYLNALAKGTSASATTAGADSSMLANIKSQIASGNYDLNDLLTALTNSGMSGAEAVAYLRQLGAKGL